MLRLLINRGCNGEDLGVLGCKRAVSAPLRIARGLSLHAEGKAHRFEIIRTKNVALPERANQARNDHEKGFGGVAARFVHAAILRRGLRKSIA